MDNVTLNAGTPWTITAIDKLKELWNAEVAPETYPVLDGEVGILAPLVARCQFLQRGREDRHLHVLRLEFLAHDVAPLF